MTCIESLDRSPDAILGSLQQARQLADAAISALNTGRIDRALELIDQAISTAETARWGVQYILAEARQ